MNRLLLIVTTLWMVSGVVPGLSREAAGQEGPKPNAVDPSLASFTGVVLETINSSRYTYIQVDTGSEKKWVAAPRFDVKTGDRVTVPQGIGMVDFHSPTLDRTFDLVYFASQVTTPGGESNPEELPKGHPPIDAKGAALPPPDLDLSGIQKPDGGKTVAEVHAQKADLSGQAVTVRGKVVKVSDGIMGRNWIHLQDGSGGEGANDLTITTTSTLKVGDTATITGVIALDKDFGFGYRYGVIMEEAKVAEE